MRSRTNLPFGIPCDHPEPDGRAGMGDNGRSGTRLADPAGHGCGSVRRRTIQEVALLRGPRTVPARPQLTCSSNSYPALLEERCYVRSARLAQYARQPPTIAAMPA